MARPCTGCGSKRDTTLPLCATCRSEHNKTKKKNKVYREMEQLITRAGITIAWFEQCDREFRQQMAAKPHGAKRKSA